MYALAAVQFSLIILYHIVVYGVGEAFKIKTQLYVSNLVKCIDAAKPCSYVNTLIKWILRRYNKASLNNTIGLQGGINIPDKTYDYTKFQEPLVGED